MLFAESLYMKAKRAKKWVLIVDDDEEVRELVENLFEVNLGEDLKLVQAKDGVEATTKITFQAFDCIVTDLKMPRREGVAFIKSAKESQLNSNTPIIVISGYGDPTLTEKFPHIVMFDKPVDVNKLTQEVQNQLRLGSTDKRIGAGILNGYISGTKQFAEQVFSLESEQEYPIVKKPGDEPQGDGVVLLSFKANGMVNRFIVGFSQDVINKFAELSEKLEEQDTKSLLEVASKTVFHRSARHFASESGITATLMSNEYISTDNTAKFEELKKTRGLVIPIKLGPGHIYIQAIVEEQKKKSTIVLAS